MHGLNLQDFLTFVIRPTLAYLSPEIRHTPGAERLLLGTAIHESRLHWLDQTTPGPGPAFGLFQMEPATHHDLWTRFIEFRPPIAHKLRTLRAPYPSGIEQLRTNLLYSCAMARVLYYRAPEAIPDVHDVIGLATMAKRRFNSLAGKATVDDYRRALEQTAELFA